MRKKLTSVDEKRRGWGGSKIGAKVSHLLMPIPNKENETRSKMALGGLTLQGVQWFQFCA